jgi:hypothetical protein
VGYRNVNGGSFTAGIFDQDQDEGRSATFRTSDGGVLQSGIDTNNFSVRRYEFGLEKGNGYMRNGYPVRFVKD